MVVFPLFVTLFFTSIMHEGQPLHMPVGVVDNDNTSTTRQMVRRLDAFQTTAVTGHYATVAEARHAMQRNEIYAFIYFPEGTTASLMAMRQPKISFYYSNTSLTAGSLLYRDLRTITTLGAAAAVSQVLAAKGLTERQVMAQLQPVAIDLHPVNNPSVNYSVFLNAMLVPGCLLLLIFLVTPYSLGMELKNNTAAEWIGTAGNRPMVALVGKLLPYTMVFLAVMYGYMGYTFGVLSYPCTGGAGSLLLLGLLAVLAAQGFGVFMFGLMPTLRMSISVCSLWAVLSFSMVGTAFPVSAMSPALQALAWLFPLRHYYLVYQLVVFNGYGLSSAYPYLMALVVFALLPLLVAVRIKRAMVTFNYMP